MISGRNACAKISLKTLSAETANLKFEFDDDIIATKKSKGDRLWEGFIKSTRRVPSAMRNISCCGRVFEVEAGLRKFDEVGYRDQDFIAAVGEIPV